MKCCRLLCGAFVAFVALLLALPPPTIVCYAYSDDCSPMESLGEDRPQLALPLPLVVQMFRNFLTRRARGSGYVLVHIAPSVQDQSDVIPPGSVQAFHAPGTFRLVYAEPQAEVLESWRMHLLAHGFKQGDATFARTAICDHDSEAVTLYRPAQRLRLDHLSLVAPHVLVEQASLNATRLLDWLPRLARELARLGPERLASYLENETVRCTTPASLLREAGVSPGAVAHFGTDLQGQDALDMVEGFLALEGFRPDVVTFEYRGHHRYDPEAVSSLVRIVRTLVARGYDIHRPVDDIFAVATPPREK